MSVFEDLVRELEQEPARREALRAILLSEELLALPATVAALAAELKVLSAEVRELAQIVRQILPRLDRLESDVGTLKSDVGTLKSDVGTLKGSDLERRWKDGLPGYLGSKFLGVRVLDATRLARLLEPAMASGLITPDEVDEVWRADVVARCRGEDGVDMYLVVEVSAVVDRHDIDRARARSGILGRATGRTVRSVGGGTKATEGALEAARRGDVILSVGGAE